MKIIDMNKYFEDRILRRGYEYYKNNHVKKVRELGGIYTAAVEGTQTYHVTINTNEEKYDMTCDCPYEYYCKHMAAVLYYLKKEGQVKKVKEDTYNLDFTNTKELQKCLNREYKKLQSENHYTILRYTDLFKLLQKIFGTMNTEDNLSLLYDYCITVHIWVENHIQYFYNSYDEDYDDDYDYIDYDEEDETDPSDMSSNISEKNIFEFIISFILKCIKSDIIYLKYYLYFLYDKYQDEEYIEYNFEYLELEILVENTFSKEMASYLIKFIDSVKYDEEYLDNKFENWLLKLKYEYYDKEETVKNARKNLLKSYNRDFVLSHYKENNQKEYTNVLEEIISLKLANYQKKKYIQELLKLYEQDEDKTNYERIAKLNYIESPSLEKYILIKNLYEPKVWLKVRDTYILPYKKHSRLYIELLLEESEYDESFNYLKNFDIQLLESYIEKLKVIDLKRTTLLYKEKIIESAEHCYNGRKSYEEIINSLVKLYNLDKEANHVREIITLFKEKYKNRKAMLEELEFFEDTYLD